MWCLFVFLGFYGSKALKIIQLLSSWWQTNIALHCQVEDLGSI